MINDPKEIVARTGVEAYRYATQESTEWAWNGRNRHDRKPWSHCYASPLGLADAFTARVRPVLLLTALARESIVRIALWIAPTRLLLRFITWRGACARGSTALPRSAEPGAVGVAIASRRVLGSTCLSQALAAQWMLACHGYRSEFRLGVHRSMDAGFQAHAWVELEGEPVTGGAQLHRYVRFADLTSAVF